MSFKVKSDDGSKLFATEVEALKYELDVWADTGVTCPITEEDKPATHRYYEVIQQLMTMLKKKVK